MGQFLLALKRKSLTSARSGRPTAHAFWLSAVLFLVVRRSSPAFGVLFYKGSKNPNELHVLLHLSQKEESFLILGEESADGLGGTGTSRRPKRWAGGAPEVGPRYGT